MGEEGENCPLTAAVVVGNPFDLQLSSKALQRTWLGKEVYQRFMGSMSKSHHVMHSQRSEKN